MRFQFPLIWLFAYILQVHTAHASSTPHFAESRENDPESLVENVSVIYGNYSDFATDVVVPGPDSLTLSRYYNSSSELPIPSLPGGWYLEPHCYLYILKKDRTRTYTTADGTFEFIRVVIGTDNGSFLTYTGWQNSTNQIIKSSFKLDTDGSGICNTARQMMNAWTNQKTNELCFNPKDNHYELVTSIGSKRVYVQNPSNPNLYLLSEETLASGNKIIYKYEGDLLSDIRMTNSSEEKIISWIRLQYGSSIHIDTSHLQSVNYYFEQELLTRVINSHRPALEYDYQIPEKHLLLIEKRFPEGRTVKIHYYTKGENKGKVESIQRPNSDPTKYIYFNEPDGSGFTQVNGPANQKIIYRFDDQFQLTTKEEFLRGELFRVQRRTWGKKKNASNLGAIAIEDGNGSVYSYKSYIYDDKGHIIEEKEFGNLTGSHPGPLILNADGFPESTQESHTRTYSCKTVNDLDIITQNDAKDTRLKLYYKKGTNVLIKKLLLTKTQITKRWFYFYNSDGVLTEIILDDGDEENLNSYESFSERHITTITPKQDLPNFGAPEIIEEKYYDAKKDEEILLKRIVNCFDLEGNIGSTAVYDANGEHYYTVKKTYRHGLLISESDPAKSLTQYSYDANHNLVTTNSSNSNNCIDFQYDLNNRLICSTETNPNGSWKVQYSYDSAGNKISEIDRFGNQTFYKYDELGRIVSIIYPAIQTAEHGTSIPTYTYSYDLFDSITSITDPNGKITLQTHTVRGSPTQILYPDGGQELFKYDPEGSLHRHLEKNGIIKIFEYDYQGRLSHIEYYERGSKGKHEGFKREYFEYDAFHLTSHEDEEGHKTIYTYDDSGRLSTLAKGNQKKEFIYDPMGRTHAIKKWKSAKNFTLEIQEHDFLDRVIEERTENASGKILLKLQRTYDHTSRIHEIIGYPQNQKSVLARYEYDPFGRVIEIKNALGASTKIEYQDDFINEKGQKVLKRIATDSLGNKTEEIYDAKGRIVKTIKKDSVGNLLSESTSLFDCFDHPVVEKAALISSGKIASEFKTCSTYVNGKLASNSIDTNITSFEYNLFGDLTATVLPENQITYQYNEEGNLATIAYMDSIHELTHDRGGNLTDIQLTQDYCVSYEMTPNDQLSSETIKDEFGSYQVKVSYDGEGCIENIELPDGSLIHYTYEGPFVASISRQSKDKRELYFYRVVLRDQMGHVLEEVLPQHAGARKQTWDKAGRKIAIITDFFSDTISEFDLLSNIKKRMISLEGEEIQVEYNYNALQELISEKGIADLTYSYDSLGNRLQKNSSFYENNHLNQLVKTEDETYTFDAAGYLKTKIAAGKTWSFKTNSLGHLSFIENPNQTISFAYDLNGKRLSKKVASKDKKSKVNRYFYLGSTELGFLDETGKILELKVPSNPNQTESYPAIAIELQGDYYVPIYDLQGNISCLIDPQQRNALESYRYTAFGEETIFNQKGKAIASSMAQNPWRYKGKRVDPETGFLYFGKRYYDPAIGRFLSPDPVGTLDGPNLYRFCRNNPLTFVDYFGLASEVQEDQFSTYFYGEYEPHCHCENHRDCKRGGDIRNAVGGASLGVSSFFMGIVNQFVEAGFLATADDFGFDRTLKAEMHDAMVYSLDQLHGMWNEGLVTAINFDPQHEQSRFYEKSTYVGLIALDILRGNIKDIKTGLSFLKSFKQSKLPVDLSLTIERIQKNIKFPHRNDGTIFKNREGLLPKKHSTYYREYVHPTQGIDGPGPQRVIIGENSEIFYSPDHYKTFIKIK